jgi:hypothetical protein
MNLPIDMVQPELPTFTVFCRQCNNEGTTWIDTVQAKDMHAAMHAGKIKCANDWGYDSWQVNDIAVIGVAQGDIQILMWDDLEN